MQEPETKCARWDAGQPPTGDTRSPLRARAPLLNSFLSSFSTGLGKRCVTDFWLFRFQTVNCPVPYCSMVVNSSVNLPSCIIAIRGRPKRVFLFRSSSVAVLVSPTLSRTKEDPRVIYETHFPPPLFYGCTWRGKGTNHMHVRGRMVSVSAVRHRIILVRQQKVQDHWGCAVSLLSRFAVWYEYDTTIRNFTDHGKKKQRS